MTTERVTFCSASDEPVLSTRTVGMKREPKKATERGRAGSRSRWDLIFAPLLIIVTFLVYQPAWGGKPILDDAIHVTNTMELRSINGLVHLWIDPPTTRQYHPL